LIHSDPSQFTVDQCVEYDSRLRQLEAELAEGQRKFNSAMSSLAGVFYRCELESPWATSFLSEGVEALTGYSAAELEPSSGWATLMRAEDQSAVEAAVAEAVSAKRSFEVAYGITTKCGELKWVSERGCAVYSDDGTPLFLEGVIRDISGRREADELQKALTARWRKTLDAIPQMVWTMAADGSGDFFNSQWERFTGCKVNSLRDLGDLDLVHVDDRAQAMARWNEQLTAGGLYEAQYRLRHASGEYRWVLSRGEPERDRDGKVVRWYGTCTDINDQVNAREALQSSEALNRSMVDASPDSISLLDPAGAVRRLNPAAIAALGGASATSFVGRAWSDAFPLLARGPANKALAQAQAGRIGRFISSQPSAEGTRWWDIVVAPIAGDAGDLNGLLSIARDITHQKTAEERVRWAANHDPLTQLPNRTLLQRVLDRALVEARDTSGSLTVLMMDLDDFKRTNDALGHDAGDALLTEFANRLRHAVRPDDMVARLGGDEFAVLLRGVSDRDEAEAAVSSILAALKAPFHFEGKLLDIKSSIGASIFPEHGSTRSELMKHADIALYVAKGAGRGVLRVFEPAMRAEAQSRISMLSLAADALKDNLIRPFYQPKVDLRTGRLEGFEALLRWEHPVRGIQAPDTIAAAFQDPQLAADISDRMIECVMADMRRWADAGVQYGHVAINAAAAEFRRGDFAEKVLERLERANLPASSLQLEVTETVFLGRGAEHVQDALKALSAEGIQIALDDFGTGYASLSHLNHFPVNVIKIDRSFISNLETSDHDAAIVRAVINLGRSLGIKIVAEGIETNEQAEFLRRHRCHLGQGYLYAKALPADAVSTLIQDWGNRHPEGAWSAGS
jgi:diguanylate cyclase (GGDEF)-like protein/PAS domain S-box-containing protein